MKSRRCVALTGLALTLVVGCRSTQKITITDEGKPSPALAGWVGQHFVLTHLGDRAEATLAPGEKVLGSCDVAVEVKSVDPVPSGVRFALDSIGRVRVADGPTVGPCKVLAPHINLTLKPASAANPEAWRTYLGTILATPDDYLTAHGHKLDYAVLPEPKVFAEVSSPDDQSRSLARKVTSWPKQILAVEPAISTGGRVHHEGEIECFLLVGADGRVFNPALKTALDDTQAKQALAALTLWRFEPARAGTLPVASRFPWTAVLRLY
jgi:hypothetical protein